MGVRVAGGRDGWVCVGVCVEGGVYVCMWGW